jgi:hypothetical protein
MDVTGNPRWNNIKLDYSDEEVLLKGTLNISEKTEARY